MKKSFLTLAMLCLFGIGFVSQVNALSYNICDELQMDAYEAGENAGLSYDAAADIAEVAYKTCMGIE